METTISATAVEFKLSQITSNAGNPRTVFEEAALAELAASIAIHGVIQPIIVRRVGKKLVVVAGERRYRASKIAGKTTIPAQVRELTEHEALVLSITENLVRENISPMEEAVAFDRLLEIRGKDVPSIAAEFGKSESFVRSRISLNRLTENFADLLRFEEITVAQALELSKYGTDAQDEIFKDHFENADSYSSWRDHPARKLAEMLARKFTTQLGDFNFDKKECSTCPFNSSVYNLFGNMDGGGRCQKKSCLDAKNTGFICATVRWTAGEHPEMPIVFQGHSTNMDAIQILREEGYDIEEADRLVRKPSEPLQPVADEEGEPTEMQMEQWKTEVDRYGQQVAEFASGIESGEIREVLRVGDRSVDYFYQKQELDAAPQGSEMQIEELRRKDKRNREIASEKIIADAIDLVRGMETHGDFSELEETVLYFIMFSSLGMGHFEKFGLQDRKKYSLKQEEILVAVQGLTDEQKTLIIRDFICDKITQLGGLAADLTIQLAHQHSGEKMAAIEAQHNGTYKMRQKKTLEKIAAIEAIAKFDKGETPDA